MLLIHGSKVVSIALTKSIPDEKVKQIRSLVEMGICRCRVARIFGVSDYIVAKYTKDLPKRKRFNQHQIPEDIKRMIRSRVRNGESKTSLAREFGLNHYIVTNICKGIEAVHGNSGLRGFPLKFLRQTLQDGFFIPKSCVETTAANRSYKRLRKDFPMIKKVVTTAHSIYFSADKREEAFKEFINMRHNRGRNYRKYVRWKRLFGLKLTPKQKKELSERR
jgi:hypothetical protein